MVRSSLRRLEDADGAYLEAFLQQQSQEPTVFALSEMEQRKLRLSLVNATDRQIMVSIPEDEHTNPARGKKEQYESIQIQAKLAEIDEKMHFKIWIPNSDKQRVLQNWHP